MKRQSTERCEDKLNLRVSVSEFDPPRAARSAVGKWILVRAHPPLDHLLDVVEVKQDALVGHAGQHAHQLVLLAL